MAFREGVYYSYYPEFKQWRDSFGADYKDWYLHPKE